MSLKPPPQTPPPPKTAVYVGTPDCRIYPEDAVEFLKKRVRPGSVDLCFVDPPFNIGEAYGGDRKADRMDPKAFIEFTRDWLLRLAYVTRSGGSVFVHCPDSMAARVVMVLGGAGLKMVNWIILHQDFGQYRESNFIVAKHHLLYFAKPGVERTWNVKEVLEPSERLQSGDGRVVQAKFAGMRPFTDVWNGQNLGRIQGNNKERWNPELHTNQLPELYVARVIRAASNPGDLVLDCFVGSGTIPCVARSLGRRFIGSEHKQVCAESAWERVKRGPVRDVAGKLWVGDASNNGRTNGHPAAPVLRRKEFGL